MRNIFFLVFLLISSEAYADKFFTIYDDREKDWKESDINNICTGFCEGEKYYTHITATIEKTQYRSPP